MLRGAIDMVQSDQIGGWIYPELGTVVDQTVLAFMDNNCVGSGRIGFVREDLKAAGLGDGRLGFNFPISVGGESDLSRIVVKLEGSDLALLQSRARVGRRNYLPSSRAPAHSDGCARRVCWRRPNSRFCGICSR